MSENLVIPQLRSDLNKNEKLAIATTKNEPHETNGEILVMEEIPDNVHINNVIVENVAVISTGPQIEMTSSTNEVFVNTISGQATGGKFQYQAERETSPNNLKADKVVEGNLSNHIKDQDRSRSEEKVNMSIFRSLAARQSVWVLNRWFLNWVIRGHKKFYGVIPKSLMKCSENILHCRLKTSITLKLP